MKTKRLILMMLVMLMSVTGAWAQNNVIEYTAPSMIDGTYFKFSANVTSHTYDSDSKTGRIVFDGDVTYIGDYAFFRTQLTSITLPSSVTSIGKSAFFDSRLTSITLPSSVTSIGLGAFRNTRLTSITLPSSLTSIGDYAFQNTPLTSITLPSSVTSIGDYAFYDSQLTSITILGNSVTSIGKSTFRNTQLTSITLPSSVTSIGDYAFYNTQLTSITIPSGVTRIGGSAFENTQLTSITILGNSLTSIGDHAFQNTQLTSITLPSSLTSIGNAPFPCMASIYIEAQTPPSLKSLGSDFNTSSCILYVPVGTWSAYKAAAQWCLISHIGEVNCTLTVLSSDNTKGIVFGGGEYTAWQVVNICAFPTDGYYFSAWSDGNTDNPRTFSIEKTVTLTALFEKLGPGMRLKVTKKDGKVYEFPVTDLESTEYYRATE